VEDRISGITTQQNSGATAVTILSGGTYEPFGPLTGFNFGNGVTLAQGYDQDYELTSIDAAAGSTAIQNLVYGYDPSGNILSITDNLNASLTQGFQYENLNRLWTASGPYGSQTYTYDGVGNRATVTLAGVTYTYTPSMTSNQIVSISGGGNTRSFTYFATGQTKTDQRTPTSKYSYTADGVGRLSGASLNNSSIASYTHNGFEQRVGKTVGSTVTDLIYDRAGHLLAEANDSTGTMIREYIWMDDKPVAMVDDTGTNPVIYYIHSDQVNRPQKLTDASANIAWDGVFDPFGNVWSIAGSETMLLMFPGQYYDSETQLSQNWHRDYDPTIGRYVQSDPIGLKGGINTYAYAASDPIFHFDRSGLLPNPILGELTKGLSDVLSSGICDWWPEECVNHGLICIEAQCTSKCGQVYYVYAWMPSDPSPDEVHSVDNNCHCIKTQFNETE